MWVDRGGDIGAHRRLKARATTTRASRRSVVVSAEAGAERPVWYPGKAPAPHLDGSLPGDFGFDPLSLSADPEMRKWMVQAELQHARWAMLGVAGAVAPELLTKIGVADLPNWVDAGTYQYWRRRPALLHSNGDVQLGRSSPLARHEEPGSMNTDPLFGYNSNDTNTDVGYPGGLFDKLGYAKDPAKAKELKLKEIKNGRLAMVAFLGICAQYVQTGQGPVENLFSHIAQGL
ncbi:PSI-associated light-harvesting chlorophyll a/b-binding protein [Ostreococcus tauri]|uniref:Chlorophyll a-b binding protein, chloroplastic n=1 Tax=Ostreococcus tauri TaxID=70448 RepID=A0A1Y5I0I2_OSTTA|nr:PSI-associated light-harvesting chlorophyll a/b-binding protein [Ostreococcus tauri]